MIVRVRKGGRAPFRLLAPLVLHAQSEHAADAEDLTEIAQSVLRRGEELRIL